MGSSISGHDVPILGRMNTRSKTRGRARVVEQWQLPASATLGSAVRAKGILLEVRARLPFAARKLLDLDAGLLVLRVPEDSDTDWDEVLKMVAGELHDIEDLPVIPREVEDILTITSGERHRGLRDGRLQSAGTRTVKVRGRTRRITFHVFDPGHIEDVLDRDMASVWREQDAAAAAENRRRAAGKAALARASKRKAAPSTEENANVGSSLQDGLISSSMACFDELSVLAPGNRCVRAAWHPVSRRLRIDGANPAPSPGVDR